MNSILKDRLYLLISIAVLIMLWKFLSLIIDSEIILPSPEKTLIELISIIKQKTFLRAVFNTIFRSLTGFFISLILAVIIGILSGIFKPVHYIFKPIVGIIKSTPSIAIILLSLIWLGSEYTPILVGFLIIFPILYSNIIEGIRNVDEDLIEMANIYKVKKWRIIKEIYFPSILSYLMAGAVTCLGLNLKVVIAAEVLSQSVVSIGEGLQFEKYNLNTAGVFSWVIIAVIISAIFDYSLLKLQNRIEKWK
ncbi:ABC transporter permease [Caminicella sporogenes]|uniref:ABC transporter permease n=1 Tax=Caminicella sporogenes TaxID=166485 RepID=UPI00253FDB47|nr:ABC transporter permease subunit [Caminicella sporogenes]WIF94007.1 ABC transporter permease subunit [Caminicella sporogenes]